MPHTTRWTAKPLQAELRRRRHEIEEIALLTAAAFNVHSPEHRVERIFGYLRQHMPGWNSSRDIEAAARCFAEHEMRLEREEQDLRTGSRVRSLDLALKESRARRVLVIVKRESNDLDEWVVFFRFFVLGQAPDQIAKAIGSLPDVCPRAFARIRKAIS